MADTQFDISSLSEEQQLALQQYTSVTDQDLNAAIPLLQKCQWNTQIAITRFFDGDANIVDPAAEAALAPVAQESRRAETLIDNIPVRSSRGSAGSRSGVPPAPRVVPVPESQLTQPLPFPFSVALLPVNFAYSVVVKILGLVSYFLPFLPRLLGRFWSGRNSQPSRDQHRRPLSPADTAARFVREFEEEYGVTHGTIPFFEGGYAQAYDIAKRDLKYLLIVLLSPEHDDTSGFVRDTLLDPELTNFLKDAANNIILWAGSVQDAEAFQVSSALHTTRFPFAALIVHTPSVSSTAMSKVVTSAGPIAAHDLIIKIRTAMQTHNQELDRIRRQRQEQQATRNLRQEQESAYERSLAQDREKARRRKEEEEAREKVEREERLKAEHKADQARKLAQWRRWRAQSILAEPSGDDKEAVRISLRLPSGERVIRKFQADSALEELYAFVECNDELSAVTEKAIAQPDDYEHIYKFVLVSPMPREVYDLEKGGSIRKRIGRSGNLIVERIVGSDEEEDEDEDVAA